MVHGIPLRDDNYRVAVEVAFIEGAPLPIPNDNIDATLVVNVIGSFVAWPKSLNDMMIIKLYSSLFCLMPIHFIIGGHESGTRTKESESNSTPISTHPREKTCSFSSRIASPKGKIPIEAAAFGYAIS